MSVEKAHHATEMIVVTVTQGDGVEFGHIDAAQQQVVEQGFGGVGKVEQYLTYFVAPP